MGGMAFMPRMVRNVWRDGGWRTPPAAGVWGYIVSPSATSFMLLLDIVEGPELDLGRR